MLRTMVAVATAPLPDCNRTGIAPPNVALPHSYPRGNVNTNCVIGPVIYRGDIGSPLYGVMFFADHPSAPSGSSPVFTLSPAPNAVCWR